MLEISRAITLVVLLALTGAVSAVEPGLPSKTAVLTTAARAIGSKHPNPRWRNPDYLAIKFIGPRERALLKDDYPLDAVDMEYEAALRSFPHPYAVGSLFVRTIFFDDALEEALDAGFRQVVIVGAGFDSRGYRFRERLRGVPFFEVDYGPTQAYKKLRISEVLGALPGDVRYVPMDFTKDDLLTQLKKRGYSERHRTLFIWEGVTYYLPEAAVRSTLRFVRDRSDAGSLIAFDAVLTGHPNLNNPDSIFARLGEPWLFGFPGGGAAELVRSEGLEVVSDQRPLDFFEKRFGSRPNRVEGNGRYCVARVSRRR